MVLRWGAAQVALHNHSKWTYQVGQVTEPARHRFFYKPYFQRCDILAVSLKARLLKLAGSQLKKGCKLEIRFHALFEPRGGR